MKAYKASDLYNQYVQQQASEAWQTDSISSESYKKILEAFPNSLYTPNNFIRIGLGLLTVVIALFSAFLLGLMFYSVRNFSFPLLIYTIAAYVALEFLVAQKHYFNAGVDNVLITATLLLALGFIFSLYQSNLLIAFCSIAICAWLAYRFTDAFMAVLAYLSLCAFVFLVYIRFGVIAKATAPALLMLLSFSVYIVAAKLKKAKTFLFYRRCINLVILFTLLTFYAAGNYYVIREVSNSMFNLNLQSNDSIPFGWLYWIFTFAIPVFYIAAGIGKKDLLLLRTGIVLFALSCLTFRYYYHIFSTEWVLLIAGTGLMVTAYLLVKYLSISKAGFTSAQVKYQHKKIANLEAMLIAQAFGKKTAQPQSTQFGGGSFGGAGAGDNY